MDHSRPDTTVSASSDTHVHYTECHTTVPRHEPVRSPPSQIEPSLLEEKTRKVADDSEEAWEVDPTNARNWSFSAKWTAVGVVSLYSFCPPLASSMMAPGLPEVAAKYNITNPTVIALTLSIYLITFAFGPLLFAPLSEMYGRTWVFNIANIFTVAFSLGCAFAPSVGSLIALRFLTGLSGSAPIAIGGGAVSDLFSERDRASAMAMFSLGPLVGPVVGPIAGGFIAQNIGIKWVFIIFSCICGFASLIGIPLLKETYAPVLRMRLAARSADPEKAMSQLQQSHGSLLGYLWINIKRPTILLFRSAICFMLSLYMALQYGIYYLMFTTFTDLFSETYGFNTGTGGLAYIGLGVGFFASTGCCARFADQNYNYLMKKNDGVGKPEMRVPALFLGSLFIPIGLFWYGWSAQAKLHWIMPIIGTGIFGFGMMATFLPIQLYLVDTFSYAASALAAASLFRSLLGFAFPLFGAQMYRALGQGGGNSLLAGFAIVIGCPFPVWLYYRGEQMRASNVLTSASVKKPSVIPQATNEKEPAEPA